MNEGGQSIRTLCNVLQCDSTTHHDLNDKRIVELLLFWQFYLKNEKF